MNLVLVELSLEAMFLAVSTALVHRGTEVAGFRYVVAYLLYTVVSLLWRAARLSSRSTPGARTIAWGSVATVATLAAVERGSSRPSPQPLLIAVTCTLGPARRRVLCTRRPVFDAHRRGGVTGARRGAPCSLDPSPQRKHPEV